jgi:hypothetical protein
MAYIPPLSTGASSPLTVDPTVNKFNSSVEFASAHTRFQNAALKNKGMKNFYSSSMNDLYEKGFDYFVNNPGIYDANKTSKDKPPATANMSEIAAFYDKKGDARMAVQDSLGKFQFYTLALSSVEGNLTSGLKEVTRG